MKMSMLDVVDFHSHILPGADHGSNSPQITLKQLTFAKKYAVSRILATPHFYPQSHTLPAFLKKRSESVERLKASFTGDFPCVKIGAEVLVCDGLENFPGLDEICFFGTKHILLELPFFDFRREYAITASNLMEQGYDVILAHADRYPKENIDTMLEYGVKKLQLNAYSLASFRKIKHLYDWAERGLVVMLGSDIHGPDKRAYKQFSMAKNKLGELLLPIKEASDKIWHEIQNI